MQVDLEIVDWAELSIHQNCEQFSDWLWEQDPSPSWIISGKIAGWKNDSDIFYCNIGIAIEQILSDIDPSEAKLIKETLLVLICAEGEPVTDFPCEPQEGYFLFLSPERVKEINKRLHDIDYDSLVKILAQKLKVEFGEHAARDIKDYFEQVRMITQKAADMNRGIMGFMT